MDTTLAPSITDPDNYSYKERDWRRPETQEGETIIFDEPGRVLGHKSGSGTDCRSHYFLVTKPEYGFYRLRVKHGGGEEFFELSYDSRTIDALQMVDSDGRFRLLWVLMDTYKAGGAETKAKYTQAFAEGRLKKRKARGQNAYTVWIETPAPAAGKER